MDLFGLNSMYTDTDYTPITYEYKDYKQKVYALKTSATDHDLTGQIIWRAADLFARFMLE